MREVIDGWKVQLGSGGDKLHLEKSERFYLSRKLNGNRCSYYDGKLISRQGKVFAGMQHILDDIVALGLLECFIDGELVRKNVDGISDGENCRISTGIINSLATTKTDIQFVIFDIFPERELASGGSKETYAARKKSLLALQQKIADASIANLAVVEMVYEGTSPAAIDDWLKYAQSNDWEGLMLNKDARYRCVRTMDLIKIKRFHTVDLEIVELLEGEGRLEGALGAVVVRYKNNLVHLGNGFDDTQREKLWADRHNLVGRVAEVKYKEESSNKRTGLKSLQFPTFVCLREWGKEVSYAT